MRNQIVEVAVSKIKPDPENLRKNFDEEDIQALAQNIKEHGQLDPIQVFERGDGSYDLWDGERRWRAAKLAGVRQLRGIIVPRPSAVDLLCRKVSRSMQTRSLSFPEEVWALEEALKALGVFNKPQKWSSAAKKLGLTPSTLRERMRITNLTPSLRKKFEEGKLNYSISQTVGKIDKPALQEKVAEFAASEELNDRFAVLQFIPTVLEDPKRSMMESYDIAKSREKYRYAAPRKKEEVPHRVEERIDDMLEDFRRCMRWMEAVGRQDLISYLHPKNFNTRRVLTTLRHLYGLIGGFMSAYETKYDSGRGRAKRAKRELPGARRLLEAGQDSKEETRS